MLTSYLEISKFWENNPCSGGNPGFPFWFWKGKRVLEIGTGTGVDSKRFIKAGAVYTGIDLTREEKPYILKMNAEYLDFPDNHFDLVYSFGVIHHTIHPFTVSDEILRVLKLGGFIFIMLYNKPSWRYFEIMVLRRILWFFNYWKFREIKKTLPHPTPEEWISMNTDNIGCPLSRVYTKKEALNLFSNFTITSTWTENYGWFRMICGKK